MELGSTRIKAVLIDTDKTPHCFGSYDWENQYVDHIWTYDIDEVQKGVQGCYRDLVRDVKEKYDVTLTRLAGMGVSAMMHGYLAFDEKDELLVPFRTWRNTITGEASETAVGTVPVPHSPEMEHRSSLSGNPERGRACKGRAVFYHSGWLHPLETDRTEGAGKRGRGRHVPHGYEDQGLS